MKKLYMLCISNICYIFTEILWKISKFALYSMALSKTKEISFWDRKTGMFAEISRFDAHAVLRKQVSYENTYGAIPYVATRYIRGVISRFLGRRLGRGEKY